MKSEILAINKEAGITSFELIKKLKKLGYRKLGHTGTLDKFAEGLVLICTGWTTRLVEYLMHLDKQYIALIELGIETNTLDPEGEIVYKTTPNVKYEQINELIKQKYAGTIKQVPPKYSAIKIGGKRVSDRVRAGEDVELKARDVEIYEFKILEFNGNDLMVFIRCSSGTYIRSIARDIGKDLGCGAYVKNLTRIAIGNIRINNAIKSNDIESLTYDELKKKYVDSFIDPKDALDFMGCINVKNKSIEKIKNGMDLKPYDLIKYDDGYEIKKYKVIDLNGNLLGIAHKKDGLFHCEKVFVENHYK